MIHILMILIVFFVNLGFVTGFTDWRGKPNWILIGIIAFLILVLILLGYYQPV